MRAPRWHGFVCTHLYVTGFTQIIRVTPYFYTLLPSLIFLKTLTSSWKLQIDARPLSVSKNARLSVPCVNSVVLRKLPVWFRNLKVPRTSSVHTGQDLNERPCLKAVVCAVTRRKTQRTGSLRARDMAATWQFIRVSHPALRSEWKGFDLNHAYAAEA